MSNTRTQPDPAEGGVPAHTHEHGTHEHGAEEGAEHGQAMSGHEGHAGHGGHGGHGGGHGDHAAQFRRLFWIMALLAIPTVAFNGMFADLLGYSLPSAAWVGWISPILGTVIYFWGGWVFLEGGAAELRARQPGMMLLISLGITVAFLASWASTLGLLGSEHDLWWELALLVVVMLLGHWLEMRSLATTSSALDSLAALLPDTAERVSESGEIEEVDPSDLEVGDVVLVRPGGSVPADGVIDDGAAAMDESMVTGESQTVRRGEDDRVVAGTIATDSGIRVRIDRVGEDTTLAGISRLVADAQSSSSRAQRIADRAAALLFWFALGSAAITAIVWITIGLPGEAIGRVVTVLGIACPHALGLAIPLVVAISTERAAKAGVLVRDRLALESMRSIDVVVFDKTGTLTKGEPAVVEVAPAGGDEWSEEQVLALAAAAESDSEHPLAKAIVRAAADRNLSLPAASEFRSDPAVGVRADVGGKRVAVGGPNLLSEAGAEELPIADEWREQGAIILHVLVEGKVAGALHLADEIRAESHVAVGALHDQGVQVVMLTGDAQAVATSVGEELGIDRVYAGVRPEEKADKVAELQGEGRRVAMVGDGVNDAPALARADVGVAIGAGTDVAIGSAGVILASSDPRGVLSVITLSRASYRKMKQNLWWASAYNLIAVPLAAGVLAPIGFVMSMSVGALLMSASTVIVALNAGLLRRIDLDPEREATP